MNRNIYIVVNTIYLYISKIKEVDNMRIKTEYQDLTWLLFDLTRAPRYTKNTQENITRDIESINKAQAILNSIAWQYFN